MYGHSCIDICMDTHVRTLIHGHSCMDTHPSGNLKLHSSFFILGKKIRLRTTAKSVTTPNSYISLRDAISCKVEAPEVLREHQNKGCGGEDVSDT